MDLKEYFTNHVGLGVMSTSGSDGRPNAAIYARPHVRDDGSLAMVMLGRLTYENLKQNPYAHFLFSEQGDSYKGLRLSLKKIDEELDPQVIASYRRQPSNGKGSGDKECFVIYFEIEKALQLVGGETIEVG